MKVLAVFALSVYRKYISPFLPPSCRFHPTCSSYCLEAVEKHGFLKGMRFFLGRITRCHPFHPGGHDPVPTDSRSVK